MSTVTCPAVVEEVAAVGEDNQGSSGAAADSGSAGEEGAGPVCKASSELEEVGGGGADTLRTAEATDKHHAVDGEGGEAGHIPHTSASGEATSVAAGAVNGDAGAEEEDDLLALSPPARVRPAGSRRLLGEPVKKVRVRVTELAWILGCAFCTHTGPRPGGE